MQVTEEVFFKKSPRKSAALSEAQDLYTRTSVSMSTGHAGAGMQWILKPCSARDGIALEVDKSVGTVTDM